MYCCLLANDPELGRPYSRLRPGVRRTEHRKHVVFYRPETGGIKISRILHQSMLPENYIGLDQVSDRER